MEVKVVIMPSPEMVSLVQSVLAVFTANNLVDKVAEMQKFAAEQKASVFENGGVTAKEEIVTKPTESIIAEKIEEIKEMQVQPEPTRKRRTKAEIEAVASIDATVDEKVEIPDVVKLRKMTTNRMPLIPDVPALLSEFDENSVTTLAKDSEKAVAFYNRLLTISPLTAADNE